MNNFITFFLLFETLKKEEPTHWAKIMLRERRKYIRKFKRDKHNIYLSFKHVLRVQKYLRENRALSFNYWHRRALKSWDCGRNKASCAAYSRSNKSQRENFQRCKVTDSMFPSNGQNNPPKYGRLWSDHFLKDCFDSSKAMRNSPRWYQGRWAKKRLVAGAAMSIFPHKGKPKERITLKKEQKEGHWKRFGLHWLFSYQALWTLRIVKWGKWILVSISSRLFLKLFNLKWCSVVDVEQCTSYEIPSSYSIGIQTERLKSVSTRSYVRKPISTEAH